MRHARPASADVRPTRGQSVCCRNNGRKRSSCFAPKVSTAWPLESGGSVIRRRTDRSDHCTCSEVVGDPNKLLLCVGFPGASRKSQPTDIGGQESQDNSALRIPSAPAE